MNLFLGALFWRVRGIYGWYGTAIFSALVYYITGSWEYALLVYAGELPGWGAPIGQALKIEDDNRKPESFQRWFNGYFWKHYWQGLAFRGAYIGGIGAIALPLSVWLAKQYSPKWPSSFGQWGWAEVYFGMLFIAILQVGTILYG